MKYTLLEEIGRGGMGCVYKGVDSTGRIVALKMMSNRVTCFPEYRNLFQSEVDTLRRLNHPSVVHIVGDPYQDAAGNLILPMEFVEGETLEHYIARNGVMPPQEAARLMCKILEVMQYVHDRQKIHRDIKPSNIMLRADGSICMIDFGIAKDAKIGTGNTVGRIIGTDGYMSPEQADGLNIDTRTDIYSLGCVMYYMLTGKNAIQKGSNEYETINTILRFKVQPPSSVVPGIPEYIDKAVMKAMDKNMRLRYQSADEFRRDLDMSAGSGPRPDGYMSPEQADGLNIDTRTDIYSLGCVMYYMLTGKNAIQKGSNEYETINTILRFKVQPPSSVVPGIPEYIDKAVMKAMDKNMRLRYQSADEFRRDLDMSAGSGPRPATVTIGSSPDNDIVVHNEYVSRHHLVVNGVSEPGADGCMSHFLEIVDNSTNGTGVDGRPLRHASMRVEYNGTVALPQVLLAARAECPVDWNQVVRMLKQRGWNPQQLPPLPETATEGLSLLLAIVSFLIPVAGWIMWGVWRSESPAKANLAGRLGFAGFVANLLLILIIMK